jgi:hypothetical protein
MASQFHGINCLRVTDSTISEQRDLGLTDTTFGSLLQHEYDQHWKIMSYNVVKKK